jgi:hypothetical protein
MSEAAGVSSTSITVGYSADPSSSFYVDSSAGAN